MHPNHAPNKTTAYPSFLTIRPLTALEAPQHLTLDDNPNPWLWPEVLPGDDVTLLVGPPGVGKSFVALDIAARLSRGDSMPFSPTRPAPREVLLFAPDDHPAHTIAPRLRTLGADLARIHFASAEDILRPGDPLAEATALELAEALTEAAAELPNCGLIIIDPLAALLGADHAGHIRSAFLHIVQAARESRIPVLALAHTQPARAAGRNRILGPAVLSVLPRTIWHLDHFQDRRALTPVKSNLSAPPTITFSISSRGITWHDPRADIASNPTKSSTLDLADRPAFDEAREFLLTELAAGPRPAKELIRLAVQLGLSRRTLQSARESLQIKSTKTNFNADNHWVWTLPAEESKIRRAAA